MNNFLHSKIHFLGLTFLIITLLGCNQGNTNKIEEPTIKIFDGLYQVEYPNQSTQYIWIFADNIMYILYSTGGDYINYESPTHFFIENNQFFSCGINTNMKAVSLSDCMSDRPTPKFNIISEDTFKDKVYNQTKQVITLENYYSKEQIKLTKFL